MSSADIGERVHAAYVAQRLAGPAQAIVGYQELILEAVRAHGPQEAVADLEKVLEAARQLVRRLDALQQRPARSGADAEAKLRHDLRTPINAILGYTELVVEAFAQDLPDPASGDIATVQREARSLLSAIDSVIAVAMAGADGKTPTAPGDALPEADGFLRTLAAPFRPAPVHRGRILVVDDEVANRELLERRLTGDGHQVVLAGSGREALALLERAEVDLALLDVLMPDMNGIELLARLKGNDRLAEIPVLMITGLKEEDAAVRCIAAGADDYLHKPVNTVLLRARISACLERRHGRIRERAYLEQIRAEKDRANELLSAILPAQVIQRLEDGEPVIADRFEDATIIFADIVDFSGLAMRTTPEVLLERLGSTFSRFDEIADRFGIEKIKTVGDAYMAAAGLPDPRPDHAAASVAFARALLAEMRADLASEPRLRIRIGIHSGPVIAGLIGRKRFVYDVWGHTVNLASRLETQGYPDQIQISESTLRAIGGDVDAVPKGEIEIKGMGRVPAFVLLA